MNIARAGNKQVFMNRWASAREPTYRAGGLRCTPGYAITRIPLVYSFLAGGSYRARSGHELPIVINIRGGGAYHALPLRRDILDVRRSAVLLWRWLDLKRSQIDGHYNRYEGADWESKRSVRVRTSLVRWLI